MPWCLSPPKSSKGLLKKRAPGTHGDFQGVRTIRKMLFSNVYWGAVFGETASHTEGILSLNVILAGEAKHQTLVHQNNFEGTALSSLWMGFRVEGRTLSIVPKY